MLTNLDSERRDSQLVLHIDDYELDEAGAIVAGFGTDRYGYVVTPNVDHIIRHYYESRFRAHYAHAWLVLLDSRFLAHIVGLFTGQRIRVCSGSDLTARAFQSLIKPLDSVVLVGGSESQAAALRHRFGLKALHHIEPPMNFIADASAVESCLSSIEAASPFRFCFLAVGSPQQEFLAHKLHERGRARGLALCVGASVDYLTGHERRAPLWMQQIGFEWLFRLLQNPRRMARRYLLRGPLIFFLLSRIRLRPRRRISLPCDVNNLAPAASALVSSTQQTS